MTSSPSSDPPSPIRGVATLLMACGALKVLAAMGYVISAIRAPESMFRGFGVVGAVVMSAPVALYGLFDLVAGGLARRGSSAGRVMGVLSCVVGALLFAPLLALGALALTGDARGPLLRALLVDLALPAAGLALNVAMARALRRAG
ncbi:MAG: hypothetical protein R3A48_17055 [Polyangiales bacterium]